MTTTGSSPVSAKNIFLPFLVHFSQSFDLFYISKIVLEAFRLKQEFIRPKDRKISLCTGDPPSNEEPEGTYPFIVTQPSQRKVPVVQAYAYTKYLGDLQLSFNDNGDLLSYGGNPILLVQSMPEDQTILSQLKPYKEDLEELMKEIIGSTKIDFENLELFP